VSVCNSFCFIRGKKTILQKVRWGEWKGLPGLFYQREEKVMNIVHLSGGKESTDFPNAGSGSSGW